MNINWKPTYIPGDLVYNHKGEVIRITSSYLKGTRLFYYKTDEIGGSIGCILEEALKPIPLTPEILEKNGWKKGEYRPWGKGRIEIEQCNKNEFMYCKGDLKVVFLYVHSLQHFLFGLGLNSEMEV